MPVRPTRRWEELGFDSEEAMARSVAAVDLRTPEARSSFRAWKRDAHALPEGAADRLERVKATTAPSIYYVTKGPTIVNFSGGRTSGLLLHKILDAHAGVLPDDVRVVFTNTGMERNETLDFVDQVGREWGVEIHWVEYVPPAVLGSEPHTHGFRRTTYEAAFRLDEPADRPDGTVRPFDGLLRTLSAYRQNKGDDPILPGIRYRLCTAYLKIKTAAKYVQQTFGWTSWESLLGLRADEPERVASSVMAGAEYGYDRFTPLADDGVTEADVMAFWSAQRFDLQLMQGEGNCSLCYLKSVPKLLWLMRKRPDLADWWIEAERVSGQTFQKKASFEHMRKRAMELTEEQIWDIERSKLFPPTVPCTCTD